MLNKSDYQEKVTQHLEDSETYQCLESDPLPTLKRNVNNKLQELRKCKRLEQNEYEQLYVNKTVMPLFYGTIKIHKENNPIRPIVAFNDSPTYYIAKFLSKILTPITDKSPIKLRNSIHAKQELQNLNIPDDYILVSFDVKSLFTSIPVDLALSSMTNAIQNDDTLQERTGLRKDDVMELSELCMTSNCFQQNGRIYK